MGNDHKVQVHQSSRTPSASSSSSRSSGSSSSSKPRSSTPNIYRDYDAHKHSAKISRAGGTTIINYGKPDFDPNYPSPPYGGAYQS